MNVLRGYSSELAVASRLVGAGFEIAFPHGSTTSTDLVVRYPGGCWQSIQVKAGSWPKDRAHPTVDLRQGHRSPSAYTPGHIDFFIVWLPEHKNFWVFPGTVNSRSIRLEPSLPGFNNFDALKETSCRVCPHPRP